MVLIILYEPTVPTKTMIVLLKDGRPPKCTMTYERSTENRLWRPVNIGIREDPLSVSPLQKECPWSPLLCKAATAQAADTR